MPKLVLKSSEFADIIVAFLLDKLMNPSDVVGPEMNEDFNVLTEVMNRKGMRPALMKYYIGMGSGKRLQYKRIKNVFRQDKRMAPSIIEIRQDDKKKVKDKEGILKRIKDKVLKMLT